MTRLQPFQLVVAVEGGAPGGKDVIQNRWRGYLAEFDVKSLKPLKLHVLGKGLQQSKLRQLAEIIRNSPRATLRGDPYCPISLNS